MKTTQEHVDRAVRRLLAIMDRCTPEQQPSEHVLAALEHLLELHHRGTPAHDAESRLMELEAAIERLKTNMALGGILGGRVRQ